MFVGCTMNPVEEEPRPLKKPLKLDDELKIPRCHVRRTIISLPRLVFVFFFLQCAFSVSAAVTETEELSISLSSALTCDLNLSAVCTSCGDPGCTCLTGTCVNSLCVCPTPTHGAFCEQVPECTLASWDSVTTIYRWWWTGAFGVTLIGVHTVAVMSIRRSLRKLSPKMLLKTPSSLFWAFMSSAVILRFISVSVYGISVAAAPQIILYNVPISLIMASFLLIGLLWLYMLKRIKNSSWTSRRTNIIVLATAATQVAVQTLLIGSSLFLSADVLDTIVLVYQLWLGLTFIAFLIFVIPTTFRALRLLHQIQDFVSNKAERKASRERAATRRVAVSLIGGCVLIGILLITFVASIMLNFQKDARYWVLFHFIWRFIEVHATDHR